MNGCELERPGPGGGVGRASGPRSAVVERANGRGEGVASFNVVMAASAVGLAVLVVALALRNRELGDRVDRLQRAVLAAEKPTLVEGERLPRVTARDGSGRIVRLVEEGGEAELTLLLVSSESCGVCEALRPEWDTIAESAEGSNVRVLELVLDAEPSALADVPTTYPRLAAGDDAWSLTARMPGIPGAILVDASGAVVRAFYGEHHDGLREAVAEVLVLR